MQFRSHFSCFTLDRRGGGLVPGFSLFKQRRTASGASMLGSVAHSTRARRKEAVCSDSKPAITFNDETFNAFPFRER